MKGNYTIIEDFTFGFGLSTRPVFLSRLNVRKARPNSAVGQEYTPPCQGRGAKKICLHQFIYMKTIFLTLKVFVTFND